MTPCSCTLARSSSIGMVGCDRAAEPLLEHAEQRSPGPRPGQVDLDVAGRRSRTATGGGTAGRRQHQRLGQVHAVVQVAEGAVGLEGGELRAVPVSTPSFRKLRAISKTRSYPPTTRRFR